MASADDACVRSPTHDHHTHHTHDTHHAHHDSVTIHPPSVLGHVKDAFFRALNWAATGSGDEFTRTHCLYACEDTLEATSLHMRQSLPSVPAGFIRLVCVSDTHGLHRDVGTLPACDLFVHAGDIMMKGRHFSPHLCQRFYADFNDWLGAIPASKRVVIAGNHDKFLETLGVDQARKLMHHADYLENSGTTLGAIRIYGSPASRGRSRNRAFQRAGSEPEAGETTPGPLATEPLDILVTHGPCKGLCESLKPRVHIWGHVHEDHGVKAKPHTQGVGTTLSICACTLDGRYAPTQVPIVFDMRARPPEFAIGST